MLLEWLCLTALLVVVAILLSGPARQWSINQLVYDRWIAWHPRAPNPDIVIVAIDKPSLDALGRWPWSRTVHAALLDRLSQTRARAIGLDLILAEPEPGGADNALADAMRKNGRVVLPVYADAGQPVLPTPLLANAAAAIGHIDLELDPDGVARRVYLREGRDGRWWDHMAVAMLRVAGLSHDVTPLPGTRRPADPPESPHQARRFWQRDNRIGIPFAGPPGLYHEVSYINVLRGEVPPRFFDGKLVLVGATATGLGDSYPTPTSGESRAMPGVEVIANVLDALFTQRMIVTARTAYDILLSVVLVLLAMLGHFLLTPRRSLVLSLALIAGIAAGSYGLLAGLGVWLPPTLTILLLVIAYPLWSWRRLEAVIRHLGQEFVLLDREPHLLPEPAGTMPRMSDAVERHVYVMRQAATRARNIRRFVQDSLNGLPDAALIADRGERVLLANEQAHRYFHGDSVGVLRGLLLPDLLGRLQGTTAAEWSARLRQAAFDAPLLPPGIEVRDADGRDLLVKLAALRDDTGAPSGWIVSLVDITLIREAQRQRDDTLRFLSHDVRSPQISILAMLEGQREAATALPQDVFLQRLGKHAQRTLALADGFVQLARAESQSYECRETDLVHLLYDAVDSLWERSRAKGITVHTDLSSDSAPCLAEPVLLTRAFVNLLDNAIKYSGPHTQITCTLTRQGADWCLAVRDEGRGIAPKAMARLFDKFARHPTEGLEDPGGIGLGLPFVKIVIDKHGGRIDVESEVGRGTTFRVYLPAGMSWDAQA